jgi:hypothetical protein
MKIYSLVLVLRNIVQLYSLIQKEYNTVIFLDIEKYSTVIFLDTDNYIKIKARPALAATGGW